jgi:hypothetical protein
MRQLDRNLVKVLNRKTVQNPTASISDAATMLHNENFFKCYYFTPVPSLLPAHTHLP